MPILKVPTPPANDFSKPRCLNTVLTGSISTLNAGKRADSGIIGELKKDVPRTVCLFPTHTLHRSLLMEST